MPGDEKQKRGQWRSQVTDNARALQAFSFFGQQVGGEGGGGGGWLLLKSRQS